MLRGGGGETLRAPGRREDVKDSFTIDVDDGDVDAGVAAAGRDEADGGVAQIHDLHLHDEVVRQGRGQFIHERLLVKASAWVTAPVAGVEDPVAFATIRIALRLRGHAAVRGQFVDHSLHRRVSFFSHVVVRGQFCHCATRQGPSGTGYQ